MIKQMSIFANIPANLPEELCQTLVESEHVRIERIVSRGHQSPDDFWYEQPWHEFVLLLTGSAQLQCDDSDVLLSLSAGDYVHIPAGCRHRVAATDADVDSVWLAVHYGSHTI